MGEDIKKILDYVTAQADKLYDTKDATPIDIARGSAFYEVRVFIEENIIEGGR